MCCPALSPLDIDGAYVAERLTSCDTEGIGSLVTAPELKGGPL